MRGRLVSATPASRYGDSSDTADGHEWRACFDSSSRGSIFTVKNDATSGSLATAAMAGCQTNLANSFHNLGLLGVHGPQEIQLIELKSTTELSKFDCASFTKLDKALTRPLATSFLRNIVFHAYSSCKYPESGVRTRSARVHNVCF